MNPRKNPDSALFNPNPSDYYDSLEEATKHRSDAIEARFSRSRLWQAGVNHAQIAAQKTIEDLRAQLAAAESKAAKFEKAFEDRGRWLTSEASRRKEAEAENAELRKDRERLDKELSYEHGRHHETHAALADLRKLIAEHKGGQ